MKLKETEYKGMEWIHLATGTVHGGLSKLINNWIL